MNKAYYVIFFLLIAGKSISQNRYNDYAFDRYISDSLMDNIPYGVYFSHQEFLTGNPSIKGTFNLKERSPEGQMAIYNLKPYVLKAEDTTSGKMEKVKTNFWCVYDEKGMYLHKDGILYRLVYSGRYNICSGKRWKVKYPSHYNVYGNMPNTWTGTPKEDIYIRILDFKTGEWYDYTVSGMKRLLIDNSIDLYNEFIAENRKKKKIGIYFKKLSSL